MKNKTSDKDQIASLLKSGWELGSSDGRYWLQEKLCCGGKSINVHAGTMKSMLKKGIVPRAPKKPDDSFWLTRYTLTP